MLNVCINLEGILFSSVIVERNSRLRAHVTQVTKEIRVVGGGGWGVVGGKKMGGGEVTHSMSCSFDLYANISTNFV